MTPAHAGISHRAAKVSNFAGHFKTMPSVRESNIEAVWELLRVLVYGILLTRAFCDPIFEFLGNGDGSMGVGAAFNVLAILIALSLFARRPLTAPFAVFGMWGPFLVTALGATLYAPDFGAAVRQAFVFLSYWSLFVIPFFLWRDLKDLSRWIMLVMASSIVPSLYALVDIAGGMSSLSEFRLQSTFTHPNIYAFYIVLLIGLALYVRSSQIVRVAPQVRTLIAVYIPYLLLLLILTKTRSAWIACAFIMLVYAFCINRKYLAGFLLLPLLIAANPSVTQRLTELTTPRQFEKLSQLREGMTLNSYVWRAALWESAIPQITDKPFLGHGLASFRLSSPSFFELIGPEGVDAHNFYLQTAFDMGLLGLLALLWLLGSVAWRILKGRRQDPPGVLIMTCCVIGYGIECYSDNMQFYLAFNWYFWFTMGAICAWVHNAQRASSELTPALRASIARGGRGHLESPEAKSSDTGRCILDKKSRLQLDHAWDRPDDRTSGLAPLSFCLASLRRGRRLWSLSALASLLAGLLYAELRPSTYTASSELLIDMKEIQVSADLAILAASANISVVQNQIELIRSGEVLTKAVASLERFPEASTDKSSELARPEQGGAAGFDAAVVDFRRRLKVHQLGESHLISVSYKAADPEKAARAVNTVIGFYLQELARASDAGPSKRQLRDLYQSLGPSALVVSSAQPPIKPDGPPAILIAFAASLVGLCVGAVAAILREATNDTIRRGREVERALGMYCLGVAPTIDPVRCPGALQPDQLRHAAARLLEASIRGRRIIGVTSALPGEGATTIAVGLARALAASGKQVLLIDGVEGNRSVSQWATKFPRVCALPTTNLQSSVFAALVEAEPGLHVLTRHIQIEADAHSIGSPAPEETLRSAVGVYDLVIVDMPALASGPDIRVAASSMDGFLLVVKWDTTESKLVQQALQSSGDARQKFFGAILNMTDEESTKAPRRRANARIPDTHVIDATLA